mmetsp:Transcript_10113/g.17400  ORF Transcript_10113/g.17400 Transcript_10113/m.17400 type:complete len:200 (-) Transcript_10113:1951-2550(-)
MCLSSLLRSDSAGRLAPVPPRSGAWNPSPQRLCASVGRRHQPHVVTGEMSWRSHGNFCRFSASWDETCSPTSPCRGDAVLAPQRSPRDTPAELSPPCRVSSHRCWSGGAATPGRAGRCIARPAERHVPLANVADGLPPALDATGACPHGDSCQTPPECADALVPPNVGSCYSRTPRTCSVRPQDLQSTCHDASDPGTAA